MKLMELYKIATNNDITIDYYDLTNEQCFTVQDQNYNCYIAIDYKKIKNEQDETIKLAHELGHCVTGAFYSRSSPLQLREQCEFRANLWAIKKLIPKDELNQAVKNGIFELWDLAEYFEVSEDFIKKAIEYYRYN